MKYIIGTMKYDEKRSARFMFNEDDPRLASSVSDQVAVIRTSIEPVLKFKIAHTSQGQFRIYPDRSVARLPMMHGE